MRKFPEMILRENFSQAWEYAAAKYCAAKRSAWIEKITSVVGNFLFLGLALLLSFGGVYLLNAAQLREFMEGITWLWGPWQKTLFMLEQTGLPLEKQIIVCLCLLYLIPLAVCGLLALLMLAVCHPKKPRLPEGTDVQKAEALLQLGKDTQKLARRSSGTATTCTIMYVVAVALFITAFMFNCLLKEETVDLGTVVGGNSVMAFTVGAMVLIFAYALVNYVLLLLLKLLRYCHIPKGMIPAMERYYKRYTDWEVYPAEEENLWSEFF